MLTEFTIVGRLSLAALLGGIIGLEREQSHKVAGIRTHALTATGAALLSLISIYLYEQFPSISGTSGFDYHLIANVIVGIGFIGGGAIMKQGSRIVGTTTAATLWMVAAVGIAVGVGFVYGAFAATLVCYLLLTIVWYIERGLLDKEPILVAKQTAKPRKKSKRTYAIQKSETK